MADMFFDRAVKQWLAEWEKNPNPDQHILDSWIWMTVGMFDNYPAILVYDLVEQCAAKSSDEKYNKGIFKKSQDYANRPIIKRTKGKYRKVIDDKLKIIEVAEKFGLKVKKNKTVCPFHNDTDPSLVFYPKTNSFFCFGCRANGDVIEFIRRMKEVGQKRGD